MVNFEKLNVYHDAIALARSIYSLTKNFPKEEIFGVISQLRRAAVSVSINVAEGSSRSKKEFAHFIDISRGSCYELIALLRISADLNFISSKEQEKTYQEIELLIKKLNALKNSLGRP